jgi:hypothetical protein
MFRKCIHSYNAAGYFPLPGAYDVSRVSQGEVPSHLQREIQ